MDIWLCGDDKASSLECGFADSVDYIKFIKTSECNELDTFFGNCSAEVLDASGNKLTDTKYELTAITDVSAWSNGTYYFKVTADNNSFGGGYISVY